MRFPDEDDYRWAGRFKRLWYRIICPFTFGARLWMVTTSILCALAVMHSANGSWGYHGNAQDTGFLSSDYVNGVRLAWQIDAADAGLDRIDDYIARDGHLFLVGYRGSQRIAVGYDASHSTPPPAVARQRRRRTRRALVGRGPPRRQYTDLSSRWEGHNWLAVVG